jgi:hypothetical protein
MHAVRAESGDSHLAVPHQLHGPAAATLQLFSLKIKIKIPEVVYSRVRRVGSPVLAGLKPWDQA